MPPWRNSTSAVDARSCSCRDLCFGFTDLGVNVAGDAERRLQLRRVVEADPAVRARQRPRHVAVSGVARARVRVSLGLADPPRVRERVAAPPLHVVLAAVPLHPSVEAIALAPEALQEL